MRQKFAKYEVPGTCVRQKTKYMQHFIQNMNAVQDIFFSDGSQRLVMLLQNNCDLPTLVQTSKNAYFELLLCKYIKCRRGTLCCISKSFSRTIQLAKHSLIYIRKK